MWFRVSIMTTPQLLSKCNIFRETSMKELSVNIDRRSEISIIQIKQLFMSDCRLNYTVCLI